MTPGKPLFCASLSFFICKMEGMLLIPFPVLGTLLDQCDQHILRTSWETSLCKGDRLLSYEGASLCENILTPGGEVGRGEREPKCL